MKKSLGCTLNKTNALLFAILMAGSLHSPCVWAADATEPLSFTDGAAHTYDSAAITSNEEDTYGIYTSGSSTSVTINDTAGITTSAARAHGILAENSSSVSVGTLTIETAKGDAVSGAPNSAYGILARNNSTVTVNNATITTHGYYSFGLWAFSSTVNIEDATITTDGGAAYGMYTSSANVEMDKATITTTGQGAHGIFAAATNPYFTNTVSIKEATIKTSGQNAYGISIANAKNITIGTATITTTGEGGRGLSLGIDSNNGVGGSIAIETLNINTKEKEAYGLYATNGSTATIGTATITTTGEQATGVYARSSSTVNITDTAKITTKGASAVYANNNASISFDGEATLTVNRNEDVFDSVYGVYANRSSSISFAKLSLTSDMDDIYGLYALNSSITINGEGSAITLNGEKAYGLYAADAATITAKNTAITTTGVGSYNLYATSGGTINAENATVTNEGSSSYGLYANNGTINATTTTVTTKGANSYGLYATNNGIINATNSTINVTGSNSYGIYAENGGTVTLKNITLNVSGANAYGIYIKKGATLNIIEDTTLENVVTINLDNNTAHAIYMEDGITVDLTADSNGFSTLTTSSLLGTDNTYVMDADFATNKADQIIVTGADDKVSGKINLQNVGALPTYGDTLPDLILINSASSSDFTLGNGGYFESGAWAYTLTSAEASVDGASYTAWRLQNAGLSAEAHAALASAITPEIWHLETNALYEHLGEFNAEREDMSYWISMLYNKSTYDAAYSYTGAALADNNTELHFRGLATGFDKRLPTKQGQLFTGIMLGYGEGDLDYRYGNTKLDSFHLGLYSVYRTEADWYVAGLLKYNRYKTDMTVYPREEASFSSEYKQNGYGASILAGKQFKYASGFYLEPQVEFGVHRIMNTSYTLPDGLAVNVGDRDSARLRGGLAVGKAYSLQDGSSLDIYAKASLLHEFAGSNTIYLGSEAFRSDYSGTWGQYKLGARYQSAKDYFVNLALSYEKGGSHESPLGLQLSVSWLFN